FSSRRRHTRWPRDWSSDVCSSDLHFKELEPHFAQHRQMVEDFLKQYWDYYRELLAYRERPGQPEAERFSGAFDQLFSQVTGCTRSEERRVGKECRSRCGRDEEKEK